MPTVSQERNVTIVKVVQQCGSIDDVTTEKMAVLLSTCAELAEPPLMVIDFSDTNFFGAAFVGTLVRTLKRLKARGGRLGFCNLAPMCSHVLRLVRLDAHFEVFFTRQEAIDAFAGETVAG